MNKLKSLPGLAALVLLMISTSGLNAEPRPFPHEESDLPVDAGVEWGVLENGLRWVIFPWSEPPERVSLRLLVEAGSLQETDRQKGLAHLIEHMAFNGTRNFSAGEMVEYFQRLGMAFGPDTNAHTWWRETVYKLELPDNDPQLLHDGLRLLRDYADGMLLQEEEIEKEKGVVLSEYRDRDSAAFKAYKDSLQFSLPDSLISRRVVIGDRDVIRMANRQDLVDYYETWYVPQRMVLIAVGEVDPDEIRSLFAEYFADMEGPDQAPADPDLGTLVPVDRKVRLFSHPELPDGSLEIFKREKIDPRPDLMEHRLEALRADLANAMLSRRLERLSKEEDAPFSRGSGYDYRWLDFVRYTGVDLTFKPENRERAMEAASTELRRALEYGFNESELAEVKANLINRYEEAAARAPTRKSRELSSQLVRSVRDNRVFMDPVVQRDLMVPAVEAISLDEVESTFRRIWAGEERLIHVSGNFEDVVEGEFEEALGVPVEAPVVLERREWAYTDFGEPSGIVESRTVEDLGIHQYVFGNGVRLNLKQTDYEANKIHVKASFGGGKLTVPIDKPGLDVMAAVTFEGGGLGEHSAEEIKALMAGKTVGTGFNVDDSEFTLGGVTNAEDLLLQLQLMAAYMTDPGYRPEGRRLFMRRIDGLYSRLRHDPNGVMQDKVARFLAGGDYRFGFPEQEELQARTLEEVAAWLESPLREGYLELSIVGDFTDREGVLAAVARTFGALPERRNERRVQEFARQVEFPRAVESKVFTYESEIDRGMATVNWPTTDQDDIFTTRRLSVLASAYSDRMRIQIREDIGEAYSPYAFNSSSDTWEDYGVFRAVVGVQPDRIGEIESILLQIGDDMASDGITEDELVRAIEPIKSQIEEYRRTNGYWLNSVLLRSQDEPRRLEWARSFAGFWETITVEEINELAAEYLQPEAGLPVRILPRS